MDLLVKLPHVLAAHHEDAILEMNGIEPPIEGLVVFATSTGVFVSWECWQAAGFVKREN